MAHYTGMKALQNNVHKSGADISAKNLFTAKIGELLPVYWDIGIPNRSYDINIDYFTRTRPVNTAAYTRIREYFDFYAVPIDLLWKSFDNSVIQMGEVNPTQSLSLTEALTTQTDLPWCTLDDLSWATVAMNSAVSAGDAPISDTPGFKRTLNMFGFNSGDLTHKLLTYLNYGNYVSSTDQVGGTNRWWNHSTPLQEGDNYTQQYKFNTIVNILPLLAYQKIYQDFFRWSQWEAADPTCYNVDYYNGNGNIFGGLFRGDFPLKNDFWNKPNMFTLRYCNWHKDLFMSMLPNSQFGDIAIVDVDSTVTDISGVRYLGKVYAGTSTNPPKPVNELVTNGTLDDLSDSTNLRLGNIPTSPSPGGSPIVATIDYTNSDLLKTVANNLRSQFSILALRQAEATQKWREISQSVDTNYRDQIKAHFGINVPQEDSHMCKYIGGIARNLDISEVVNNNLSTDDSQAYIYGKGVGTGNGHMTYKTEGTYCILMCIYHAIPLLDYDITGQDGQLLVSNTESLPIPEFDNIGMQPVSSLQLSNDPTVNTALGFFLGYNPRYFNWKTKIDRIHGAFTTVLKDWVAPVDSSYLSQWFSSSHTLTYQFFKVNPNTLDSIFQVQVDSTWETDQLLVNCNIDCRVVNPLSADGMPY